MTKPQPLNVGDKVEIKKSFFLHYFNEVRPRSQRIGIVFYIYPDGTWVYHVRYGDSASVFARNELRKVK